MSHQPPSIRCGGFFSSYDFTVTAISDPRVLPTQLLSSLPGFDPRQVPVLGVDAHLPAVDPAELQAAALRQRFLVPPAWQPELREEPRLLDRPVRAAAVLLAIVMHEQPTLLLTQRTAHLSSHSGQIAFPGGRVDAGDADASATALRETQEEIGLAVDAVQVLGQMPPYLTGSAYRVTPVVALVQPGFTLHPNADEVADVFEVPLAFLMNPAHHQRQAFEWQGQRREWFAMPYRDLNAGGTQRYIWGATAGMLRNFYRLLSA